MNNQQTVNEEDEIEYFLAVEYQPIEEEGFLVGVELKVIPFNDKATQAKRQFLSTLEESDDPALLIPDEIFKDINNLKFLKEQQGKLRFDPAKCLVPVVEPMTEEIERENYLIKDVEPIIDSLDENLIGILFICLPFNQKRETPNEECSTNKKTSVLEIKTSILFRAERLMTRLMPSYVLTLGLIN